MSTEHILDPVTLTLPRDAARDHLAALESLILDLDEWPCEESQSQRDRRRERVRNADRLREALHTALYCTAREVL